jgi:hypothetical protein
MLAETPPTYMKGVGAQNSFNIFSTREYEYAGKTQHVDSCTAAPQPWPHRTAWSLPRESPT